MKTFTIAADWKDTESLINGFKKAIQKLGGKVYVNPNFNGSDSYGFIISKKPMTKSEINEWAREEIGNIEDL